MIHNIRMICMFVSNLNHYVRNEGATKIFLHLGSLFKLKDKKPIARNRVCRIKHKSVQNEAREGEKRNLILIAVNLTHNGYTMDWWVVNASK